MVHRPDEKSAKEISLGRLIRRGHRGKLLNGKNLFINNGQLTTNN
jgi:hypothetical protein